MLWHCNGLVVPGPLLGGYSPRSKSNVQVLLAEQLSQNTIVDEELMPGAGGIMDGPFQSCLFRFECAFDEERTKSGAL